MDSNGSESSGTPPPRSKGSSSSKVSAKRKEQLKRAQLAYKERRQALAKSLETRLAELEAAHGAQRDEQQLMERMRWLEQENARLRAAAPVVVHQCGQCEAEKHSEWAANDELAQLELRHRQLAVSAAGGATANPPMMLPVPLSMAMPYGLDLSRSE
ncbi:hypothetical protein HDU98_011531 [Podochytrium sp. JEL0797]|nr:hypothetical protein HDU98_011531 [Podochytrium sp. JEL0797]